MIDELPIEAQESLVEKIRPIVADMIDEYRWNRSYQNTSQMLEVFALKVRKNEAQAFDTERL
jgi:hypothetical protein